MRESLKETTDLERDDMKRSLTAGKLKRLHVNQHIIRANGQCASGDRLPPITIKTAGENVRAWEAAILGASVLTYSPDRPLSCGAKLWVETDAEVVATVSDCGAKSH